MIRKRIENTISEVLGASGFTVEYPSDANKGDLSTNVALVKAKELEMNPRELAEEMVSKLNKEIDFGDMVEKIEVAGPGFINFWIKDKFLILSLKEMVERGTRCMDSDFMSGKKVLIDYSSPNIAKRFSVGHLRSTIIGQALMNLYAHSGAEVTNDNHLGDWGTQFGMIIAAIEEKRVDAKELSVGQLEDLYVDFNKNMEYLPSLRDKAREAFARLERGDADAREIWKSCVAVSMKEFDKIYEKLGVKFEHEYGESVYEKMMPEIIEEAIRTGVAVEGEGGALVVKFEENGKEYMPPAMIRKSNGTTTYLTRDLATIRKRLDEKDLKADLYIYEVGAEQSLHFRQLFEVAGKLWDDAKDVRFKHVSHGLMTLPEGKMSTRKGRTVKLDDLLEKASEEAKEAGGGRIPEEVSEKIGIGAVKYNELRRSPEMDYVFRWEEALSMEGNSGPYLQYVYVRTKGILDKAGTGKSDLEDVIFNDDEKKLARWLVLRMGDGGVVESAAKNFGPHLMCQALFELCQRFNGFYDRNRVVGVAEESQRLLLVRATNLAIRSGLEMLGIEVVDKM